MGKIRLGLVGCGLMMGTHAKAVDACTDAVRITAVCDIHYERAAEVAAVLNDPFITTDYTKMLDHVDAVLVALPQELHYECGMFCAMNKKHVLMEKPLCNSEEECLRLIETCEENGVTLMCAYPVRYWPGIVKLKELVDSGEYGKVIMMSVWTEQLTRFDKLHWTNTAKLAGGQLFCHGCHYIDLLLWFLGQPVSGTHIGTRVGTEWLLREGTSAVTMKFANGAVAYHGATWGARGTRLGYDFQVQTEKGLLDYDHAKGTITFYSRSDLHIPGKAANMTTEVLWSMGNGQKSTQYEILHFADCVCNGKTAIRGTMDQVGGGREIFLQIRVFLHQPQHLLSAHIAIFADQLIAVVILTEAADTGSQHDQLAPGGQGHAGAINCLVAQPGAFELLGIQVCHHLLQRLGHLGLVDLLAFSDGCLKNGPILADVKALYGSIAVLAHGGQHIQQRQLLQKCFWA